jgi:hypothetical protein
LQVSRGTWILLSLAAVQAMSGRRSRGTFADEGGQQLHDGRMVGGGVDHDAL